MASKEILLYDSQKLTELSTLIMQVSVGEKK